MRVLTAGERFLWLLVVLFFVGGDLLTTRIGWQLPGVVETGPTAVVLGNLFGFPAVVLLKLAVVGWCYHVWRRTPAPFSVGVPFGLAVLGVFATAWNLAIISAVVR